MSMQLDSRIYVAGHRGLVGSAIMRCLQKAGYQNIITRTHAELDLMDHPAVRTFFEQEKPQYVFLAAAKVGGILANDTYLAEFIHDNLAIQDNVIHEAWWAKTKRPLFLGSSCVYPRVCPQPIKEEYLLTGPLEPTNRAYAIAKIAGIEMCWSYQSTTRDSLPSSNADQSLRSRRQLRSANLHVLPALIRRMHEAKERNHKEVVIWGTGEPRRE